MTLAGLFRSGLVMQLLARLFPGITRADLAVLAGVLMMFLSALLWLQIQPTQPAGSSSRPASPTIHQQEAKPKPHPLAKSS